MLLSVKMVLLHSPVKTHLLIKIDFYIYWPSLQDYPLIIHRGTSLTPLPLFLHRHVLDDRYGV